MKLIGDFHIHGRYAQACSKNTTIDYLEKYARIKGVDILGTGDAFHPLWFKEITSKLTEDETGILWTKNKFPFLWQTEVALMYTHNGKGRRIHYVLLFPSKDVVEQTIDVITKRWRVDYDGRPIFGISSVEFMDLLRSINENIEVIPGHVWTSWMAIFGSKSGYDSVEECFEDRVKYIHALETGMSSTPDMNRRLSKLDKYNLVSFSDPHTYYPWRIGREATLFDCELTYKSILNAIRTGEGLKGTIETFAEYGKYHFDGHRNCNIVLTPEESKKLNGICPKCKRELTIGVAYRIEQLADREKPENVPYFARLIPLTELIAAVYGVSQLGSKSIWEIYNLLINRFGNEFNVLLNASAEDLNKVVDRKLVNVIIKNREGRLKINPGFDGVYGTIILEKDETIKEKKVQKSLSEF